MRIHQNCALGLELRTGAVTHKLSLGDASDSDEGVLDRPSIS